MTGKSLEIQFNTEIVKKLKALKFQVDQLGSVLFILFCLYENNLELLDEFDDYNKQKRAVLLYKDIESRGLILQETKPDKGDTLFSLTKEGTELVEYIKSHFTSITSERIAVSGVDAIKEPDPQDVDTWIDEWIDIFPRGVKSGGRLLRSDLPSCLRKMKIFLREYKYSKETIMQATRNYINSKAKDAFAFTRCAVYFIYRVEGGSRGSDRTSDLATWCEQTLHDGETSQNDYNNLEIMA